MQSIYMGVHLESFRLFYRVCLFHYTFMNLFKVNIHLTNKYDYLIHFNICEVTTPLFVSDDKLLNVQAHLTSPPPYPPHLTLNLIFEFEVITLTELNLI